MGKGDVTKGSILDDAVQLASRVGLKAMTIGSLAEHTAMSKSGLFAHFRSKEQLQLDVLDRAHRRFVDLVVRPALGEPRGIPRLRALFEGWLRWSESLSGGCIFVSAAVELDDQPGPVRDSLVRSELDWLELLGTVARTAIAEGHFRVDVDPEQIAYELHAVTLAHQHASRLLRDESATRRARQALDHVIDAARPAH
jgi:AcrR family transcriptional regulator